MKRWVWSVVVMLLVGVAAGCGGGVQRAVLPAGVSGDIAVLSLAPDTKDLNDDQIALLRQTMTWMERDRLNALKKKGLNPVKIEQQKDFSGNGHLLKVAVLDSKLIPKSARFGFGMMAGADRLNLHYDLIDRKGKTVLSWDDVQASTKSGTHCAETLNRNAADKVAAYLGGK